MATFETQGFEDHKTMAKDEQDIVQSSQGTSTLIEIDPEKEKKMMRKFDVSEILNAVDNS